MDPLTALGIAGGTVGVIIALTEILQNALALPDDKAPIVALIAGVLLSFAAGVAQNVPVTGPTVVTAVLQGIGYGVAAVGTHTAWMAVKQVANPAAIEAPLTAAEIAAFTALHTPNTPPPVSTDHPTA